MLLSLGARLSGTLEIKVDFGKYVEAGYNDFVIELSNEGGEKVELTFYRVTAEGALSRGNRGQHQVGGKVRTADLWDLSDFADLLSY